MSEEYCPRCNQLISECVCKHGEYEEEERLPPQPRHDDPPVKHADFNPFMLLQPSLLEMIFRARGEIV